ncbi:hypothetical protein VNI00_008019 [Paramarasmius palmivorus]|uniref:Uncharacterized protein n=1 Tax=Paramarasmius palmivorus TaxID=297713 RepID=A0AAW0CXQ1_9AGAR
MQTPKSQIGYSNFFSSGFRGIYTRGTRPRATSLYSFSSDSGAPVTAAPKRKSFLPISSLSNDEQRTKKLKKLLDRVNEANPFRMLKDTRRKLAPQGIGSEDSDECSSSGSGSHSSRMSVRIKQDDVVPPNEPCDPFSPSPDTKSIYIDLPVNVNPAPIGSRCSVIARTQSQPSPRSSPTTSFLSLGSAPSSRRSSIKRPASVHSVPSSLSMTPITSRPRRLSVKVKGDKYDFGWSLREEVEPVSLCPTPEAQESRNDWVVDPGEVDWRQFHVDFLSDE